MENFLSFGLHKQILTSLEQLQFKIPTPVQAQVLPHALEGKDILASAQTGTGKTAAFGLPLISKLMASLHGMGVVITPTRELAVQVMRMLESLLGREAGTIKTALLIGGEPIHKQLRQLKSRPRLIVGTPGRMNDHLKRRTLKLDTADMLILDEADRMLDMGFAPQIDEIVQFMPENRQTLLFSATLPHNIMSMAKKYLKDPVRVTLAVNTTPIEKLDQEIVYVSDAEKYSHLVQQLEKREGSVVIFVKTKMGTERIAKRLRLEEHSAFPINGDLSHQKRERTITDFRHSKFRILVATDIAARGLDISHIKHVVNYDLPQCPEDYIHRVGRTARAGAEGSALCFVSPADRSKWSAINRLINPDQKQEDYDRSSGNGKPRRFAQRSARPAGERSSEGRSFSRSRDDNASGEKRFSRPEGNRSSEGRSFSRSRDDNASGEKRFARPEGSRSSEGRSFSRSRDDNASGEKRFARPEGERSSEGRSFSRSRDDRPSGEKRFARPEGSRSSEGRSFSRSRDDRPSGEKRFARPEGERSSEGRSFSRSRDDRPSGEKRFARPEGSRSSESRFGKPSSDTSRSDPSRSAKRPSTSKSYDGPQKSRNDNAKRKFKSAS